MFLVDTNVLAALRRPNHAPSAVAAWAAGVPVAELYLSVMSIYELDLGVRRIERRDSRQGEVLRAWFTRRVLGNFRNRILSIDDAVAARCAELQVLHPRPERDSFIAATALVHRLTVVTRNERDYAGTGVKILNPWESSQTASSLA
jgi:predicted nucleic acid-binding protein